MRFIIKIDFLKRLKINLRKTSFLYPILYFDKEILHD